MSQNGTSKSETLEETIDFHALVMDLGKKSQSASALVQAALLENAFEQLLLMKMRRLSNRKATQLFSGFGPLATFSAKIEIAHAFKFIGDAVYRDAKIIKDIRNQFAHALEITHFKSASIEKLMKKFGEPEKSDPMLVYDTKVKDCLEAIKQEIDGSLFSLASQPDDEPAP